jgi:glycosyltransferase involved in cell wall biosynthesis
VRVLEPTNDVQRLYHASDLFVTCSRAEGMPFAMAEALSSGLPVVASDIPGQAWMGRSLPGCVLAPLEPAALAEGIRRLLSRDHARAARDADASREWVRAEMGLPQWGERLAGVYADSLSASGL